MKLQWSCSDSSQWPNTLQRHSLLFFFQFVTHLYVLLTVFVSHMSKSKIWFKMYSHTGMLLFWVKMSELLHLAQRLYGVYRYDGKQGTCPRLLLNLFVGLELCTASLLSCLQKQPHSCPAAAAASSLLIFTLAAETVLLDSTDMKSSLHLLQAWFSMTNTQRNSRPRPCCLSPDKPPFLWTAEP